MAAASIHVMELEDSIYQQFVSPMLSHINVGTGTDCSIAQLAELMAEVVGFTGKIVFDPSKPDGTPRKLLDVSRLKRLGWEPKISLPEGLKATYAWFVENQADFRAS